MKKILYSFFLLTLGLPLLANAATFSFSPSVGSFTPGDTFSVVVSINPSAGEEITVAKLSAQFPADILEVVSFTLSDGWMSPTSGEFDSLDNTAGNFEKMAGFPARVTGSKQFGVVTLKAKTVGTAIINAGNGSMILDIANSNKYVISSGAVFSIIAPAPKVVKKVVEKSKEKVVKEEVVEKQEVFTQEDNIASSTLVADKIEDYVASSSLATVSEAGKELFTTKNILFSIAFIIFVILGFLIVRKNKTTY